MRTRQARPGRASMAQARGMLMLGLVCFAVRVCARANTRGTVAGPFPHLSGVLLGVSLGGPPSVTNFEASGATEVMRSFVRMTPDEPGKVGALWSRSTLRSNELSLEWKFRIGGKQEKHGGTFALVISPTIPEAGQGGRFFGIDENFTGLAVIVNTNRQPPLTPRKPGDPAAFHRDVAIVANNGTRSYDDLMANLDGCTANMKSRERKDDFDFLRSNRIRLKVYDNRVAVEVDAGNSGRWRRCGAEVPVDMPPNGAYMSHVGVIAQTLEGSSYQDLVRLQVYTDPNEAWNTDIYGEDQEEMDVAKQRTMIGDLSGRNPPTPMELHAEPMHGENPISIREKRAVGKRALKEACSDSVGFARCHHDRGSALQLEKCLQKRGRSVSGRCTEGIEAWKSLLIETAPDARNMPPALGKESPGEGGSSHAHAAKNKAKQNKPAPVDKHAVGRGISKNGIDNKRTSQVHRTPMTLKRSDSIRSSSPGKRLRGEQDGGRGGAPPPNHRKKQHAPHRGGPSRSHHRRGAGGGNRTGPSKHRRPTGSVEYELSLFVYLSLELIYFLSVTGIVKRLAQYTNRHRGASGDDSPEGYRALPEDDAAAAVAGFVSGQQREGAASAGVDGDYVDNDDAIVVTGTPVNLPPSVHL